MIPATVHCSGVSGDQAGFMRTAWGTASRPHQHDDCSGVGEFFGRPWSHASRPLPDPLPVGRRQGVHVGAL